MESNQYRTEMAHLTVENLHSLKIIGSAGKDLFHPESLFTFEHTDNQINALVISPSGYEWKYFCDLRQDDQGDFCFDVTRIKHDGEVSEHVVYPIDIDYPVKYIDRLIQLQERYAAQNHYDDDFLA